MNKRQRKKSYRKFVDAFWYCLIENSDIPIDILIPKHWKRCKQIMYISPTGIIGKKYLPPLPASITPS